MSFREVKLLVKFPERSRKGEVGFMLYRSMSQT